MLAVAGRHGMTDLRVFGSVARGQDTDDSDLDLLVQGPEGTGLLALGRFKGWRTCCTCRSTSSPMTASSLASGTASTGTSCRCEP